MKDRRVAKGISKTASGWRLYVRIKGKLTPHRVRDPYHEKTLEDLKALRDEWRVTARAQMKLPPPSSPNTFAYDAREKYLPAVAGMPSYRDRQRHMELWIAEFGDRPSNAIEPWEIATVRERWRREGPKHVCVKWSPADRPPGRQQTGKWITVAAPLSVSQVNLRLRALENFYTTINGRHGHNPARVAGELAPPAPVVRSLDYDLIELILSKMPDRGRPTRDGTRPTRSLTKLRATAIAYNGFSHAELGALEKSDLHLDAEPPWAWVGGRGKGKGTTGVAQPLTTRGADAVRALVGADGLGPFSRSSMWKSWMRACAKVPGLEPPYPSPYALRHSYATELLEKTGDLRATQLNMRHKSDRTTRIYAERAIEPMRLASLRTAEARGAFAPKRRGGNI